MPLYTDQAGRNLLLPAIPGRIISLVPSQTELLYDLGLRDEVTAITKFCIHPDKWFRQKTRIGGTKQLDIDRIKQLQPDLIIANKEENVKEQVEELGKEFPIWVSDINNLEDALQMIYSVGTIVDKINSAQKIIHSIKQEFSRLHVRSKQASTAYLIWNKPYMSVGADTFISHMMGIAGFKNIFADQLRYPQISIEELKQRRPALVLLSSEPYPFKQKHIDELQAELPSSRILLVDGEMFSWYGSRLLQAPRYFEMLWNRIEGMQ